MRKAEIALLFLLALVPAAAEKRLLCGGMLDNRPVFLIAEGRDVSLAGLDGKELLRESNVIAADIEDGPYFAFLKEDSIVWLDEKLHRHDVSISKITPYLSMIQEATHLALIKQGILLVPDEIPYLLNLESEVRRPFSGAFLLTEKRIEFDGMGAVWAVGKWIVLREGKSLRFIDKATMESVVTVPLRHSSVADIWLEGKEIQILLQNGGGYRVIPSTKTVNDIPKDKNDEVLIRQHIRFWNDSADNVVELRFKDVGALSLISAWKRGRMEAEISVKLPGRDPVVHSLSFSMKTLGKFRFNLHQVSGALVLDFHEKDIVVTKETAKIHFFTILDGQPYAVAGGGVYSWDSSTCTVRRVKGEKSGDE